eukprot:scaffold300841_cov30-Tisochrysis_lutea.AAC.1
MTPITVKRERPGIMVSVMEGGPSQNVCSGTSCSEAAADCGPLTFSFGSLDFALRGLAFEGCGL